MSSDVVFVPEAMYEMAADLEVWAEDLRATGDDVEDALHRFRSSSSEFVPALPAHGEAIDSAADLTVVLGEDLAHLAAAAEEADRLGARDLVAAAITIAAGIRVADQIVSVSQGILRHTRAGVSGRRVMNAVARTWNIARQYGSRPNSDMARVRARTPGGATLPRRPDMQAIRSATYRDLQRQRQALLRQNNQSRAAIRNIRPLIGSHVRNFLNARPQLRSALRWGGAVSASAPSSWSAPPSTSIGRPSAAGQRTVGRRDRIAGHRGRRPGPRQHLLTGLPMEGSPPTLSFKHRPRLPQLWIAFMIALPIIAVVAYTRPSETPPAPYSLWWITGTCLAVVLLTGVLFTRASWGTVEVDEDGLHIHGNLAVPADRLGAIQLLSWSRAGDLGGFGRWNGRRLKSKQNLYGGGMGLGRAVVVEHVRPGQEPSMWLLPGPRAKELAEALELARANAQRRHQLGCR